MTLDEFKAWLAGYEEHFDHHCPTVGEWNRIKEQLSTVHVPHEPGYGLNYPPNVREYVQQPFTNPRQEPTTTAA